MNDTENWASQIINELFDDAVESKEKFGFKEKEDYEKRENSLHLKATANVGEVSNTDGQDTAISFVNEGHAIISAIQETENSPTGLESEFNDFSFVSPILKSSSKTLNGKFRASSSSQRQCKAILSSSPFLKEFPTVSNLAEKFALSSISDCKENVFRLKLKLPNVAESDKSKLTKESAVESRNEISFSKEHFESELQQTLLDSQYEEWGNNMEQTVNQKHLNRSDSTSVPIHSKSNTPPISIEKLEESNSNNNLDNENLLQRSTQLEHISSKKLKVQYPFPLKTVYEDTLYMKRNSKVLTFDEISETDSECLDFKIQIIVDMIRKFAEFFEACFVVPIATFIVSNMGFLEFVFASMFCSMHTFIWPRKSKLTENTQQTVSIEKIKPICIYSNSDQTEKSGKTKDICLETKTCESPKSLLTTSTDIEDETDILLPINESSFKDSTKMSENVKMLTQFESKATQCPELSMSFSESSKIEIITLPQLEGCFSSKTDYAEPTEETVDSVSSVHEVCKRIESLIVFSEEEIPTLNSENSYKDQTLTDVANTVEDIENEINPKIKYKEEKNSCSFFKQEMPPDKLYNETKFESLDILSSDPQSIPDRTLSTNAIEDSIRFLDCNSYIRETCELNASNFSWCCLTDRINNSQADSFSNITNCSNRNSHELLKTHEGINKLSETNSTGKICSNEVQNYEKAADTGGKDLTNFKTAFPVVLNSEQMLLKTGEEYKNREIEYKFFQLSEKDEPYKFSPIKTLTMESQVFPPSAENNLNVNWENMSELCIGNKDYFELRWNSEISDEKHLEGVTEEKRSDDSTMNECSCKVSIEKDSFVDNSSEDEYGENIDETDYDESSADVSLEVNYTLETTGSSCIDTTCELSEFDSDLTGNTLRNMQKRLEDMLPPGNRPHSKSYVGQLGMKFYKGKLSKSYEELSCEQFHKNILPNYVLAEIESLRNVSLPNSKLCVHSVPNLRINTGISSCEFRNSVEEVEPLTNYFDYDDEDPESQLGLIDLSERPAHTDHFLFTEKVPLSQFDMEEVKLERSEPFEVSLPSVKSMESKMTSSSDSPSDFETGNSRVTKKKKRSNLKYRLSLIFRGWKGFPKRFISTTVEQGNGYKKHHDST